MKVKYGDAILEAPSAGGIVHQMHEAAFERERSDQEYMLAAAQRAETQYGKPIRVGSPEDFIEDLIQAELLEKIPG